MGTLGVAGGRLLGPDLSVERGDVLIDTDAGEVLEVGEGVAASADERLDASGGLVMPGLVNAHTHAAMTLLRGYADDKPLEAWLREDVWPIEGAMTPEDVAAGTRLALAEMIRSGTTAFVDMYFHVPAVAEAVEAAGLRARVGHGVVTVGKDKKSAAADVREGLDVLDVGGDRVETAVMPHSLTTVGEEHLADLLEGARDAGVPVHVHANETTGEVDPIVDAYDVRPLSYARHRGLLTETDFLAHGVHLDDSEIAILAECGAGVVHCPASNMKLASGMAPVQRLLDAGVTVGLGTDGAASNNDLDVFGEMRDAALLGKLAADDASAVDARSVVRMATEGGAACAGLPVGRLEAGGPADCIVVDFEAPHLAPDHDPVSHLVYAARGSDVRHTVVDGEVLMRDRELLTLAEPAVREAADRHARELVERAGADG